MVAVTPITEYPRARLKGLPDSPLTHIQQGFLRLLSSPRAPYYRDCFKQAAEAAKTNRSSFVSPRYNGGKTYAEQKSHFLSLTAKAAAQTNISWRSLDNIAFMDIAFLASDITIKSRIREANSIENEFIGTIIKYMIHEVSWASPRAIIACASQDFERIHKKYPKEFNIGSTAIPDQIRNNFQLFSRYIERYFANFELQQTIGEAFFTPERELSALPQITGRELKDFFTMMSSAFALRFPLPSFAVVTAGEKPPQQNSVVIDVGPNLEDIRLPLMLIGPKIACDIKNAIRVVNDRERELYAHDKNNEFKGCSLVKLLRGKTIEGPVTIKIKVARLTSKVWELRFSDNGRGIIVNELFQPLVAACKRFPGAVAPALGRAVLDWEKGDPFAFNNIPLGDLLEAIYHLGVSTTMSNEASGMGLWGSMAMLLRLGAQIKVGINPKDGGFYESVILPVDLSVSAEEVEKAAQTIWQAY
jgi:hypothetical protein